ncbi:MAG: FHA domain-containing protein [Thermogutta sp.]
MALVTLRIVDGADRGRVFENLPTPISVGREEGNSVRLNDERVSRFHLKIQEDRGRLVLTDLASTNGTKVNGEPVQVTIVRPGDVVALGKTVILVGSREEIAQRLAEVRKAQTATGASAAGQADSESSSASWEPISLDFELDWGEQADQLAPLHEVLPPELPEGLSPAQYAQLAEIFHYMHYRIRRVVRSGEITAQRGHVKIDDRRWQALLDLYDRVAGYLKQIGEPTE